MSLCPTLRGLLVLLGLCGICTGFVQENCIYSTHGYNRVHSVPGDVAMLNSTLVSHDVFDFPSVLYNFTWYNSKTNEEIRNESSQILILNQTLWFLKTTLDDEGEYMTVLRTPSRCYYQTFNLIVDQQGSGECWRPEKVKQTVSYGEVGILSCPLRNYIKQLNSYNITSSLTWLRGCDPIQNWTERNDLAAATELYINVAGRENDHFYTCTLTFTLGGVTGSVSETINPKVNEETYGPPQVQEPTNEVIKAQIGSSFRKRCLVFLPCVGKTSVTVMWFENNTSLDNKPPHRVYTTEKRNWSQDVPVRGIFFERLLIFSELKEEDFHRNYTCQVFNDRGNPQGYFTLLPADPNILLPIGLVFAGAMVLFISSVIICYVFKIDIVLWFRRAFPGLYANTDLDSKLYDAYVAYPQPCDAGFSEEVEKFALHTLPKVLENSCGYQLFIAGRDCLPGEAIVDSVEENLKASRCVLLLYTASTFISKKHTGNHDKIPKSSNGYEKSEKTKTKDEMSSGICDDGKQMYPDAKQQFTCAAAMHKALMEGSLKVILVEMEEISSDELALLPESVRQLRKAQGAVCLWKNQKKKKRRSGTCMWRREDEEKGECDTQLSPAFSPSSRFWKEMKYHMPVKRKGGQ